MAQLEVTCNGKTFKVTPIHEDTARIILAALKETLPDTNYTIEDIVNITSVERGVMWIGLENLLEELKYEQVGGNV